MTLSTLARRTLRQALGNDSIGQEIADRLDEPGVSASTMIDALGDATSAESLSIRQSLGLNGYISVKDYGAVGDGRKITGLVNNSSSTLTGSAGTFSQADVGKTAWAGLAGGTSIIAQGVVSSVNANGSTATLSGAYSGNWTGIICYIGTDDTAAIQNAWTAAKAAGVPMYVPAGTYFVNRQVASAYNENTGNYGVIGDGSQVSRFVLMPDFSFTGATGNGVINLDGAGWTRVIGIGIDGTYRSMSMSGKYAFYLSCSDPVGRQRNWGIYYDLSVQDLNGWTGAFQFNSLNYAIVQGIMAYNFSYLGISFNSCIGTVKDLFSSNGSYGPYFTGGSDVSIIGGTIDEHGQPTVNIDGTGTRVTLKDMTIYGAAGTSCTAQSGTSNLTLDNCFVTPYNNHNNSSGISVGSGCTVQVRNSRIVGTGTGKCVTGAGTLIDEGGNTFTGTVDVTTRKGTTFGTPLIHATKTPANASATGTAGEIAWDSSYIYVCTATNTWKRIAIATW